MNDAESPSEIRSRSPLLMSRGNSALLVIDLQERLLPHIDGAETIQWNTGRLIDGAGILGVPVHATEQYPKGLGLTVDSIRSKIAGDGGPLPEKTMFSCRECTAMIDQLAGLGIRNLVLCGIETHVCVGQTALDFMATGFDVFICVDAVGSRSQLDHNTALRRLENSGAVPVTTESVLFEWCEAAGSPEFKQISKLVQQTAPAG
ncbi:MAG: hydrolase [Planctomycetota bacterium]